MPCVAEVVNRSLKANCTDFTHKSCYIKALMYSVSRPWSLTKMAILVLYGNVHLINAPINCFHQGPEGGQTPGELKKCEFTLSNSPPKGEKL